jgi:TonB family protein
LEGEVVTPQWKSTPSGADLQKEYPKLAQILQLGGSASIRCATNTEGRLEDCTVVSEQPVGFGFGAAALRMAAYFSVTPAQVDGQPTRGRVTIPIKFVLGQAPALPAELEPPPPTSPAALELARKVVALQQVADRYHDQASPWMTGLTQAATLDGDIKSSTVSLDAIQQGLDDVIQEVVDRQAHILAANMTDAQLHATLDFLESPAGKALVIASRDMTPPRDFLKRVANATLKRLCVSASCDSAGKPTGPSAASN